VFQAVVAAYADNVIFTECLSEVIRAQDQCMTLIVEVKLHLNPAESHLHFPEWRSISAALLPVLNLTPFHNNNLMSLIMMVKFQ
jgi:hypothetical protein